MINYTDTVALMQAVERFKAPATALLDTFFPVIPETATTSTVEVQFRKGNRRLAPYVVRGAKSVNVSRDGFKSEFYQPPMMAPSRVIDPEILSQRGFGEGVYSTKTGAQRATEMQARDLAALHDMILNRKNKMAADILTTGKCEIKGYADDGKEYVVDTIDYGWNNQITPATLWDNAGATIYDDIRNASMQIQENAGMVPTVLVVGKNVASYLFDNDQILKYLNIPSNQNLTMFNFQPKITAPQVMMVGRIASLNIEVYSYMETYLDDDGTVKPFLGENDAILGIPGRGRQLHGAVTLLNDQGSGYNSFIAPYVPYYNGNKETQELKLTMYSRCVLAPETVDDFVCIKTKGE